MSAGGGLENAGLANRESDATNTDVTGLRMAVVGACRSELQHLDSLHNQPSTPAQISRERNILDSRGTHLELVKASPTASFLSRASSPGSLSLSFIFFFPPSGRRFPPCNSFFLLFYFPAPCSLPPLLPPTTPPQFFPISPTLIIKKIKIHTLSWGLNQPRGVYTHTITLMFRLFHLGNCILGTSPVLNRPHMIGNHDFIIIFTHLYNNL